MERSKMKGQSQKTARFAYQRKIGVGFSLGFGAAVSDIYNETHGGLHVQLQRAAICHSENRKISGRISDGVQHALIMTLDSVIGYVSVEPLSRLLRIKKRLVASLSTSSGSHSNQYMHLPVHLWVLLPRYLESLLLAELLVSTVHKISAPLYGNSGVRSLVHNATRHGKRSGPKNVAAVKQYILECHPI
jgi:hypothetical protein